MTGPAVDVEQRDADLAVGAVIMSQFIRSERPNPIGHVVRLIADAIEAERAKRDDLIRRQDAALTAVRELADELDTQADTIWQQSNDYDGNGMPLASAACRSQARAYRDAQARITLALASPDTTQEDDRG